MKRMSMVFLALCLTAALFAGGKTEKSGKASPADSWPKQNITIIMTHGAGGDTDYNARLISRFLEKKLGVSVVVNNVTGSNGNIAMSQYRNGKADGYTFVMTNTAALTGNEATGMANFGYDAFEPVCVYGKQSGENIIVPADSPYNTLADLIKASQEKPNTIKFGISTGGGVYIASVILGQSGAKFVTMDEGDGAARMTALLGKHSDMTIVPYATAKQYIEAKKVKSLATLLKEPPTLLKDISPASKAGVSDLIINTLYVCLAPKGTDKAIVEKFNKAIMEIVTTNEDYKKECLKYNLQDPWALSVADTIEELKNQREHFMKFAKYLK